MAGEPALDPGANKVSYRVTPQDCWEQYRNMVTSYGLRKRQKLVSAKCETDSDVQGGCTYDCLPRLRVEELVYPGDANCRLVPKNKWILLLEDLGNDIAPLFEAYVNSNGLWDIGQPLDSSRVPSNAGQDWFDLPEDPKGKSYRIFLSPFRVTPYAFELLKSNIESCTVKVELTGATGLRDDDEIAFVCVPDPFDWADDAHEQFFQPRIEAYKNHITNEEIQSKRFVAQALKSIISAGDEPGISNNLRSAMAPEDWLNKYAEDEAKLAVEAERAHAYLANWVDSYWHAVVEAEAMELGGIALALTYTHWSNITDGINETSAGQKLAAALCTNEDRFPRKYVISQSPIQEPSGEWTTAYQALVEGNGEIDYSEFKMVRRVWKLATGKILNPPISAAAIKIFGEFIPSYLHVFRWKAPPAIPDVDSLGDVLRSCLANVGVETLQGPYKVIHRNVMAGREPLENINITTQRGRNLWEGSYQKLLEKTGAAKAHADMVDKAAKARKVADEWPTETFAQKLIAKLDDVFRKYTKTAVKGFFDRAQLVSHVLDITNFAWSIHQYLTRKSDGRDYALGPGGIFQASSELLVNIVKPSADIIKTGASAIAKPLDAAVNESVAYASAEPMEFRRAVYRQAYRSSGRILPLMNTVAGAAGVVSGVIEMVSREEKLVNEGIAQNNYGVSAGHSIALGGAAISVVGASMILVQGISAGAFFGGPIGATIGAIGGVVVAAGAILVSLTTKNPYEAFAAHCFLGEKRSSPDQPADKVTHYWWGSKSLGYKDPMSEARVLTELLSNFTARGNQFVDGSHLLVRPGYIEDDSRIEVIIRGHYSDIGYRQTHIIVDLYDDSVKTFGDRLKSESAASVVRDEQGRITYVLFDSDYPDTVMYGSVHAFVRIEIRPNSYVPLFGDWLHVDYPPHVVSSLDPSRIVSGLGSGINIKFRKSDTVGETYSHSIEAN